MKALSLTLLALTCATGAAEAKTHRFICDNDLAMSYEGEESGTLSLTGPYGAISLPASRSEQDGMFGIRANGDVSMIMPDKAALAACVAEKAKGETDSDIIFTYALGCAQSVAASSEPVDARASVEIAVMEPPDAMVFIMRSYRDPPSLPGDVKVEIPAFPLPSCSLASE